MNEKKDHQNTKGKEIRNYNKIKVQLNKDDIVVAGKNYGEILNLQGFDYISIVLENRQLIMLDPKPKQPSVDTIHTSEIMGMFARGEVKQFSINGKEYVLEDEELTDQEAENLAETIMEDMNGEWKSEEVESGTVGGEKSVAVGDGPLAHLDSYPLDKTWDTMKSYATFRQALRQLMFNVGVPSNLGYTDRDIVYGLAHAFANLSTSSDHSLKRKMDAVSSGYSEDLDDVGASILDRLQDFVTTALLYIDDMERGEWTQQDMAYWRGKHKGYWDIDHYLNIWRDEANLSKGCPTLKKKKKTQTQWRMNRMVKKEDIGEFQHSMVQFETLIKLYIETVMKKKDWETWAINPHKKIVILRRFEPPQLPSNNSPPTDTKSMSTAPSLKLEDEEKEEEV